MDRGKKPWLINVQSPQILGSFRFFDENKIMPYEDPRKETFKHFCFAKTRTISAKYLKQF